MISLGLSKFARERHQKGTGNSFFDISLTELVHRTMIHWERRYPGQGETNLERKVVVPIDPTGFYISMAKLQDNMPLRAEVVRRQPHEDPYVEVFIDTNDADRLGISPIPATYCSIVCYSAEALLENDGERTTNCPWEIVAILASNKPIESMPPLTMARNFLQKAGGTKSIYSAEEFANAIYENSVKGVKIKDAK